MSTPKDIENKLKAIFKKVLDIQESEIIPDAPLDKSLDIDSTEMVELTVALKRAFNLTIPNNQFKKTQTFNEIATFIKSQGA